LGFGAWGLGIGIWGFELGVWGLAFGVWRLGFEFRVWGLIHSFQCTFHASSSGFRGYIIECLLFTRSCCGLVTSPPLAPPISVPSLLLFSTAPLTLAGWSALSWRPTSNERPPPLPPSNDIAPARPPPVAGSVWSSESDESPTEV
jgi:hypothetical protein